MSPFSGFDSFHGTSEPGSRSIESRFLNRCQWKLKGSVNHTRQLRDLLQEAQQNAVAVGHFNVSDLVLLKAVFAAARELNVPVLVGLSEGEREFVELVKLRLSCEAL
jgi:hypothetical protein